METHKELSISIKKLIAGDRLPDAVQLLIEVCGKICTEFFDSAVLLSLEVASLKKAEINGIVSWEEKQRQKNRLAHRLLKLTNLALNHQ